jgi:hypothetical protein
MDQLEDPERGMRIKETRALEKALADGTAGDPLIEPSKRHRSLGNGAQQRSGWPIWRSRKTLNSL